MRERSQNSCLEQKLSAHEGGRISLRLLYFFVIAHAKNVCAITNEPITTHILQHMLECTCSPDLFLAADQAGQTGLDGWIARRWRISTFPLDFSSGDRQLLIAQPSLLSPSSLYLRRWPFGSDCVFMHTFRVSSSVHEFDFSISLCTRTVPSA
jgi:hypothetical protein